MPLTIATGYADLGMWLDAWESIEDAPEDQRASPDALRLRLRCCVGTENWELGEHLARLLAEGAEEDRQAAARYYHALARQEMAEGNPDFAKEAIRKAVAAWPEIRIEILDDPTLEAAW